MFGMRNESSFEEEGISIICIRGARKSTLGVQEVPRDSESPLQIPIMTRDTSGYTSLSANRLGR